MRKSVYCFAAVLALCLTACSDKLTRKQALTIVMRMPETKSYTSIRITDIYQDSPTRATVRVSVGYPLQPGRTTADSGCEIERDKAIESCSTPLKMLRYDSGWDVDKDELARQEAARRQAAEELTRQLQVQNQIESDRVNALREQNEETERQIRQTERETRQIELETWGPGGPPKGVNSKACRAWTAKAAAGQITDPPPPNCT